jgi:hypothetical protein
MNEILKFIYTHMHSEHKCVYTCLERPLFLKLMYQGMFSNVIGPSVTDYVLIVVVSVHLAWKDFQFC